MPKTVHTCNWGRSCLSRNSTNRGTTPALITSSIGGQRSAQICQEIVHQLKRGNDQPIFKGKSIHTHAPRVKPGKEKF